jgi:type IV pilus assembly protein PilX
MHIHNSRMHKMRSRQHGAALVIGLILLLVITILAVSGMNTSTVELQMAGNTQYAQKAFQAAEIGLERGFRSGVYDTNNPHTIPKTDVKAGNPEQFEATTRFDTNAGVTPVIGSKGFSMGVGTGFSSYHFNTTGVGTSSRNAQSTHVQSFYVVGPAG